MKFDFSTQKQTPYPSPEYIQPYGSVLPPLKSKGNLSYLQFIDVVNKLWSEGHPEIKFGPFGEQKIFNPELGYIIYTLEDKKPKNNSPKPKPYETVDDPTDPTKKLAIFIESFYIIVKFTAIHKVPRVAEEIIEEYEDFMIQIKPMLQMLGLESISYVRRMSDSHETRYGDDLSSRSIAYMVGIQKVLTTSIDKLDSIFLQVQAIVADDATPSYEPDATPITYPIYTSLLDNNTNS